MIYMNFNFKAFSPKEFYSLGWVKRLLVIEVYWLNSWRGNHGENDIFNLF